MGHVCFLQAARSLGDVLVVGLNSDDSVRQLKGANRPIVPLAERAALLAELRSVDHIVVFDDLLPTALLEQLKPNIHCKAADYTLDTMPEAEVVQQNGGRVEILTLVDGYSTTRLIERICG